MKKRIIELLTLLAFTTSTVAQTVIPNNTVTIGKTGSADKTIELNLTKAGASANPKIKYNNSTAKIEVAHDGVNFRAIGSGSGSKNYIEVGDAESGVGSTFVYAESDAVTFQDTGDTVTLNSHGLENNKTISFTSITSTTGISTNTVYYVVGATTNTFQVASTIGGSAIALTTNGSGTLVRSYPKTGASGGSPSATLAISSSSPLDDNNSWIFTKGASNLEGNGGTFPFTIDASQKAKTQSISFRYVVNSGTFVPATTAGTYSDVVVYIYDVTNSTLIQPSNINLFSSDASITGEYIANFQPAYNSTSYRLILHVQSPSTSAYSLKIDSIKTGPSTLSAQISAPSEVWLRTANGYASTNTNTPRFSTITREVGSAITYADNATTGPTFTINETGQYSFQVVGNWGSDEMTFLKNVSGNATSITVNTGENVLVQANTGASNEVRSVTTHPVRLIAGDVIRFVTRGSAFSSSNGMVASLKAIKLPNVTLDGSKEAGESRELMEYYTGNAGTALTADVTNVDFSTKVTSTHGAFNGTTFTAYTSGTYNFKGGTQITTNSAHTMFLWVNGVKKQALSDASAIAHKSFSTSYPMNAGDTAVIRSDTGSITLNNSATNHFIVVTRSSSTASFSVSDTVAASYYVSSNFAATTSTPINYDTREYDSHGMCVPSATIYRCTAPLSGIYTISVNGHSASTTSYDLYKNGTIYKGVTYVVAGDNAITGTTSLKLLAGDYIDIRPSGSVTVTGGALSTHNTNNMNIRRVGNY